MESNVPLQAHGERVERPPQNRQKKMAIASGVGIVMLGTVSTVLAVTLSNKQFSAVFLDSCKKLKGGYDCQKLWRAFEQAYVGRDPCQVPMEAYDPFIAEAHFKPACNRMLFWSKTKDVVHDFTNKRDCFVTLEDTLLGSVVDGLTWCGKEGSKAACGDVTAMLNGSIETPYSPHSIFASIEAPRLSSKHVKKLKVVLVTQPHSVTNCETASLKDLQKQLDRGIVYNCQEVPEAKVQECASNPHIACGACW
ncbi:ADP-ribosyl cyclase/cyclic ADP-ribose hydrolase 1 [Collichthys lucidus]|uniref:ADP-ribosyl cyclase/cyclic ADP-ribose hydrolase n=1 Tax=Collichthys lucidus TaxID=240159 RepID=A0A4U5VIB9_COLLU|nr:ADP-ribosyl cyclase/cyclic ADP-ribose hydrolase 1 [Collichthys lucidus]